MSYVEILVDRPVQYRMAGKFQSPSKQWIHMKRHLKDYELIFITDGILYIEIDNIKHSVEKGKFLLCPANCKQEGFKKSNCSFYWLHFMPNDMDNEGVIDPEDRIKLPIEGEIYSFEKIIVMMKQLQDSVRSYQDKKLNNYLSTAILCEFHNQYNLSRAPISADSKKEQIYNDILDYIKWHKDVNLRVIDIANHFGYNEKYLSHVFQSIKGMSLKQYMLQQKVELAKYMLVDTNDTVATIAKQLGYNDSYNFMKLFKKRVGLTPTEYRNTHAKRLLFYI